MMRLKAWLIFTLSLAQIALSDSLAFGRDEAVEIPEPSKKTLIVLPILFYTPETKMACGIGGLFALHPGGDRSEGRPSSFYFYAIYTQRRQFSTQWEPEIFLSRRKYFIKGKLTAARYPNKYWGIGSDSPLAAEENYTPRIFSIETSFQKKILPGADLYAGLQFRYENFKILRTDSGGLISGHKIPGSLGGTVTGAGFILNRDIRDDVFFPRRGDYWQMSMIFNSKVFGGDFNYTSFKLDLRKYFSLFATHVLAVQGVLQAVSGTAPFSELAKLGGSGMMRGYYFGRFRDKIMVALQAEYRMPVGKRIGLVGFAGLGDVRPEFGGLGFGNLKYSAGAGLRFRASSKEATNIRLDFAFGKNSSGFYFTAREAF